MLQSAAVRIKCGLRMFSKSMHVINIGINITHTINPILQVTWGVSWGDQTSWPFFVCLFFILQGHLLWSPSGTWNFLSFPYSLTTPTDPSGLHLLVAPPTARCGQCPIPLSQHYAIFLWNGYLSLKSHLYGSDHYVCSPADCSSLGGRARTRSDLFTSVLRPH